MVLRATTPYGASVELLRIVWHADYRSASHLHGIIAAEYVYFDPLRCRFIFSSHQSNENARYLLKRYVGVDADDAIQIAATKHPFYLIALGAVASRKMFTYREFFAVVRERPEWFW